MKQKLPLVATTLILPLAAWAGDPLGTKADLGTGVQSHPSQIIGGMDIIQMVLALVVVFALLKWGLPFVISKFGRKIKAGSDNPIRSLESAAFGGGTLQVVEVRDRTLLLSVTQAGATLVCDLTTETKESEQPKTFLELLDERKESSAPTHAIVDFGDEEDDDEPMRDKDLEAAKRLLSAAKVRLDVPGVEETVPSGDRQDRVREALERLSRLTG